MARPFCLLQRIAESVFWSQGPSQITPTWWRREGAHPGSQDRRKQLLET